MVLEGTVMNSVFNHVHQASFFPAKMLCLTSSETQRGAPVFPLWPAALARVLLHGLDQEPQFRPDVRKPHLRSDPLGSQARRTCQVGQRRHRISLDRRSHDSATKGRLDPSPGEAFGRVLPDQGTSLDFLGRGNEGW